MFVWLDTSFVAEKSIWEKKAEGDFICITKNIKNTGMAHITLK